MPLPPILIDLGSPPGPSTDEVAVLVDACSRAVAPSSCVLRDTSTAREGDGIVVTIRPQGPASKSLRVEARNAQQQPPSVGQDLTFRDDDVSSEIWRSVGLTAGSLAFELMSTRASSPELAQEPRRTSNSESLVWAQGLAGPGFTGDPWRFGGVLGWALALPSPHLVLSLDLAYARSPHNTSGVSGRWGRGGLGVGAFFDVTSLHLRSTLRLSLLAERLGVSVDDPATGEQDQGARWLPAGRLGLDLQWPAQSQLGIVVGADTAWTPSKTDVYVRGVDAATSPSLSIAIRAGVFVTLW